MRKTRIIVATIFFITLISCEKQKSIEDFSLESSVMTDSRDGQEYKIVKIGNQWWMAENLNYYTSSGSWYYNNDSTNFAKPYGRLYLWETIMNGEKSSDKNPSKVKGISPEGWHIPSLAEWAEQYNYIKEYGLDADDLKMDGNTWPGPNLGTNRTLFNAVPTGTVYNDGQSFANIDYQTTFLTSTLDDNTSGVWGVGIDCDKNVMTKAPLGLNNGWAVRCVKN